MHLYTNGKSAVRVDAPGVHHVGPHLFSGDASGRWVHASAGCCAPWPGVGAYASCCCRCAPDSCIHLPPLGRTPPPCRYKSADNPEGAFRSAIAQGSLVLHYAYSSEGDVAGRASRSNCGQERLAAAAAAQDHQQVRHSCWPHTACAGGARASPSFHPLCAPSLPLHCTAPGPSRWLTAL